MTDIQIHYKNLYITEKQNITGCIQCGGNILAYDKFKNKINGDLHEHYMNLNNFFFLLSFKAEGVFNCGGRFPPE